MRFRLSLVSLGLMMLASCGGSTEPEILPPANLTIIQGDGQEATVANSLPSSLVVEVTDTRGDPVSGVEVSWTTESGSATPASSTTQDDGRASTSWSLGTEAGAVSMIASATDLQAVFTATATPDDPETLLNLGDDSLSAPAGSTAPDSLEIQVLDSHGNAVPEAEVGWVVVSGGGSVSPSTSSTDADGTAHTEWTLGTDPGENLATATVSQLEAVEFHATGTADPVLQISISWSDLEDIQLDVADSVGGITHLGLRIVSPDQSAFTTSFARSGGDQQFETEDPPEPYASLYVAAVSHDDDRLIAIQFGVIDSLAVEPVGLIPVTLEDFSWAGASWEVHDDYQAEYESGTFTIDKSQDRFDLPLFVRDPFQVGEEPDYEALFIALNGSGGVGSNPEGWRAFSVSAVNPSVGEESDTAHEFFPFLRSAMFGLPSGRYMVLPEGAFTVEWR